MSKEIIVALDNASDVQETFEKFKELAQYVIFKLNDALAEHGIKGIKEIVEWFKEQGIDIRLMLDPKWNDIPNTIRNYMKKLFKHGLDQNTEYVTMMAAGGSSMLKAAVEERDNAQSNAKILAVTVLTTMDDDECRQVFNENVKREILRLARLALEAGVDGIVCSPLEAKMLRSVYGDKYDFKIITPGVRLADNTVSGDDQKRVMTPTKAVQNGADALVMGRPIKQAEDPVNTAQNILSEIQNVAYNPDGEQDYEFEKFVMTASWEELLKYIGAIYIRPEDGKYVRLASGLLSNGYINIAVSEKDSHILDRAAIDLYDGLQQHQISADMVIGAQMGSVRLSSVLGEIMQAESIYTEKDGDNMILKRHDIDLTDKKVVLSEDVITKGSTITKMIEYVKNKGGEVVGITCLVNRSGLDEFEGIPLISCYTPDPFELYYDENTPEKNRGNNPALPNGAPISEKPKNDWNNLIQSMNQ